MKILIVDDVEVNRDILEDILTNAGFATVTAENGVQAMELLRQDYLAYDVVLLDLMMPEMDGFAVMAEMKSKGWIEETPVIVISSENNAEAELHSLELGAADFIHKPFNQKIVLNRTIGVTERFSFRRSLKQQVEAQTIQLKQQYAELQDMAWRLNETNKKIIDILGTVVEFRNLESGEHIKRVKAFTRIMGQTLMELYPDSGLTAEQVELIAAASPLHDIGKITISDTVLLKQGRLTPEEFALMKTHTTKGVEILKNITGIWDDSYRQLSYDICLYHHERYDGKGYPNGLRGEEIPLPAQLVAIADVYDALISPRCYKEPFPLDTAYKMILAGQCGAFSPRILHCFQQARKRMETRATGCDDMQVSPIAGGGLTLFSN